MFLYSIWPISAILDIAYTVLTTLSTFFEPLVGAAAGTVAIVALALLLRTLLIPVGVSQMRAQRMRRDITPALREVTQKHKKDPVALQRETAAVYKKANGSPFAGFLPMLIQAPIVAGVYGLFVLHQLGGRSNEVLDSTVLDVPLGSSLAGLIGSGTLDTSAVVVYAAAILLLLGLAAVSRAVSLDIARATKVPHAPGHVPSEQEQLLERMSGPLSYASYFTLIVAVVAPLAAVVYLLVTTTWAIVERHVLGRMILGTGRGDVGARITPAEA